ncbi:putative defense protein 1 [Macrosteles quadrilineatus]|uniref:putative defense protein 1 n=1 Tax=Macrosteles quadrilineatus TaxID=74068 RepID=UPI0023E109E6|nr:putative defense protein 1 [Macrosteles quadrilineatus]XP_054282290.1 putative defense protein 1 [Macrosteles quadrilineatus]
MFSLSAVAWLVVGAAHLAASYPFEVPVSACVDMMPKGPGHNDVAAQNSKIPYDFSLERVTIRSSDSVEFTIRQKAGGPTFAAFMVQARSGNSPTPLGTFQPKGDNARTVTCSADNDTGSHNSPDPKKSVTLIWTPPTNFKGNVNFYVTVAENKLKFWVRHKAAALSVK